MHPMYIGAPPSPLPLPRIANSNEASEFYAGFMQSATSSFDFFLQDSLFLTTRMTDNVPVNVFIGTGRDEPFTNGTITQGGPLSIEISAEDGRISGTTDRDKGIYVMSQNNQNMSAYGLLQAHFSVGAYLALPCEEFNGTLDRYDYCAVSVSESVGSVASDTDSAFLVVACRDDTQVEFIPTQTVPDPDDPTSMINNGSSKTITLNQGETLYVQSREDLTGTYVAANNPLVFYSGHECGSLFSRQEECDNLVEQLPPIATWGQTFMTAPPAGRASSYIIKLMTSRILTRFNVTCVKQGTPSDAVIAPNITQEMLIVGDFSFTVPSDEYCSIEADKPILVVQLFEFTADDGSAAMTIVPAISQYRNDINTVLVSTPGFTPTVTINIFVTPPFFQPRNITVGGAELPQEGWVSIHGSNGGILGYALQKAVFGDRQLVRHNNPDATLGVIVYGGSSSEAYAYPGGLLLTAGEGNMCFRYITYVLGECRTMWGQHE